MQLVRWNWGIWKRGVWILNILFFYNIWRLEHNKFLHNFYQVESVWGDNSLPFALWGLVVVAWKGVRWKLFSKLEKYHEKGDRVSRTFTFPKRHFTWSANGKMFHLKIIIIIQAGQVELKYISGFEEKGGRAFPLLEFLLTQLVTDHVKLIKLQHMIFEQCSSINHIAWGSCATTSTLIMNQKVPTAPQCQ